MEEDISNKTIVVLVVLTVLISVLSALVVMNEVVALKFDSSKAKATAGGPAQGQVSFNIEPAPQPDMATGQIILQITGKEE